MEEGKEEVISFIHRQGGQASDNARCEQMSLERITMAKPIVSGSLRIHVRTYSQVRVVHSSIRTHVYLD